MYLNTLMADGHIIMQCPVTKNDVAHIEYCCSRKEDPWRVSFMGHLQGLPGRYWKDVKAAEYAVLAEHINQSHC